MVRTVLSMVVRPGAEHAFEEAWTATAHAIRGFPGNLRQSMLRDTGQQRRYVIFGDWASADALRAFEVSDERRALSAALEPLRESATKSVLQGVTTVTGDAMVSRSRS